MSLSLQDGVGVGVGVSFKPLNDPPFQPPEVRRRRRDARPWKAECPAVCYLVIKIHRDGFSTQDIPVPPLALSGCNTDQSLCAHRHRQPFPPSPLPTPPPVCKGVHRTSPHPLAAYTHVLIIEICVRTRLQEDHLCSIDVLSFY